MSEILLESGRAAAVRCDWPQAFELLMQLDEQRALSTEDVFLLADVAYAAGHVDTTIAIWERTYAERLREGDQAGAAHAAVRVAMHLLFDSALMAPVRGWASRAEQLIGSSERGAVYAWLAVVRAYERLLSGDVTAAQMWGERAIAVGAEHNAAAAAIGRIVEARCLILQGDVLSGIEMLNAAGVAATSGELDPLSTGIVYCELVCALQAVAQYDLAEQWTEAMERWRPQHAVGSIHGRCRVHRAEILRLRGSSNAAEQEALRACAELRPYLRREFGWPLAELGRIRFRLGDLVGAEHAFLEAQHASWNPQPGLALIQLARGEVTAAAIAIRDALEHPLPTPSKELPPHSDLSMAPLLEAQVEIAIANDDVPRARSAADQLVQIAERFASKPLTAAATAACGQVQLAQGDDAAARASFEAALQLWHDVGAPYEAARARLGVARARRAAGHHDQARAEAEIACALFQEIGAALQVEQARRFISDSVPLRADSNEFRRTGAVWSIMYQGEKIHLGHMKGLDYLAHLLAQPGRDIHVLDMVAQAGGMSPIVTEAVEPLDAQAKAAYRRRLHDIAEDIEEARLLGDSEREAQADAEREFLLRELSRAVGLGGRDRRTGSATERARVSVTRALRAALSRLTEQHATLGAHLQACIHTGVHCAYHPRELQGSAWRL